MGSSQPALVKKLRSCGWHIKPENLLDLVGEDSADPVAVDALVAALLDSDLKDVGSPSLPDTPSLQRIAHVQGPLVLQVVSVRDICQSSSKSALRTGHEHLGGRLLHIHLTDGYTVVSLIEYHPMPEFSVDVAPGTKVKLESTVSVHSGFLLGVARSFKLLGGRVPALYESWEMERKYSGLARLATSKAAREEDGSGPPPFHGLHVTRQGQYGSEKRTPGARQDLRARVSVQQQETSISVSARSSEFVQQCSNSNSADKTAPESSASSSHQLVILEDIREAPTGPAKDVDIRKDAIRKVLSLGVETAPLHNRAAAQKLLEKRADINFTDENRRGRGRGRGKGRRGPRKDEEATLTLDEWEAKRGESLPSSNRAAFVYDDETNKCDDDEVLAQRLHHQLNVESIGVQQHASTADARIEAEKIRLSMFSFAGNDDTGSGGHSGRVRGRGRSRHGGRGRGRSRGH